MLQMFAGKKRLTVKDAMVRKKGHFIEKALFNGNTGLRVTNRCHTMCLLRTCATDFRAKQTVMAS